MKGFFLHAAFCLLIISLMVRAEDEVSDNSEELQVDETTGEPSDAKNDPMMPESFKDMDNVMSFKPPDLTDEESHSNRLPKNLLCEGCMAVTYQFATQFSEFQAKRGLKGRMGAESDVIEVVEKICHQKSYENYGLKPVNGQNRISGPGLPSEKEPGMMQGGGRWPFRLAQMCSEFLGEVDDYDIYKEYMKIDADEEALFRFLCQNEEIPELNYCAGESVRMTEVKKDEL